MLYKDTQARIDALPTSMGEYHYRFASRFLGRKFCSKAIWSEQTFNQIIQAQASWPQAIIRIDKRTWWIFKNEFYREKYAYNAVRVLEDAWAGGFWSSTKVGEAELVEWKKTGIEGVQSIVVEDNPRWKKIRMKSIRRELVEQERNSREQKQRQQYKQQRQQREQQRELLYQRVRQQRPELTLQDLAQQAADAEALRQYKQMKKDKQLQRAKDAVAMQTTAAPRREHITAEMRRAVYDACGGACVECGERFDLQYDHILPVARGGATTVQNLQILCAPCNNLKSDSI